MKHKVTYFAEMLMGKNHFNKFRSIYIYVEGILIKGNMISVYKSIEFR
jgi:hypothetical protein